MKKIFFIVITIILAIFVGYVSYNSSQYTHINNLIDEAIENKEYQDVAKIFGGCSDTQPIVLEESDDANLVVFNGTSLIDLQYADSKRFNAFEETYMIYIFDAKFNFNTYNSANETGLVFSNGEKEFTYPFIVSDAVNKDVYKATMTTKEDALFSAARNITANQTTWGFMYVNLTKTMVSHIENEIGGSITSLKLVDAVGEEVVSSDVNLDYTQKFYSDINELIVNYNNWIEITKNGSNEEANNEFNEFYSEWEADFKANSAKTGYTLPFDDSYLAPNTLIFKSIGYIAVYGVIMVILYILLFKLDSFKEKATKKNVAKAQAEIALERKNSEIVNIEEEKEE